MEFAACSVRLIVTPLRRIRQATYRALLDACTQKNVPRAYRIFSEYMSHLNETFGTKFVEAVLSTLSTVK
jgi:hypothetical protein